MLYNEVPSPVKVQMHSVHKLPELLKYDYAVSLQTSAIYKLHRKYQKKKKKTCDNLLLNEILKGKARRSHDGEVMKLYH